MHAKEDDWGKMAAIYWSYNIRLYIDAWNKYPTQIRCLNFTKMLELPEQSIDACAHWFQLQALSGIDKASAIKSLFSIYSKGGQSYSQEQRTREIEQVLKEHSDHLFVAEECAEILLGDYACTGELPGHLEFRAAAKKERRGLRRFFFGAK
jgi:hypothetical protein